MWIHSEYGHNDALFLIPTKSSPNSWFDDVDHEDAWHDETEPAFGHKFLDRDMASNYYHLIFNCLRFLEKSIRTLVLDSVPVTIFAWLGRLTISRGEAAGQTEDEIEHDEEDEEEMLRRIDKGSMPQDLQRSVGQIQRLHINMVMENLSNTRFAKFGASTFHHFLGIMPKLKALTLTCTDEKRLAHGHPEHLDIWS